LQSQKKSGIHEIWKADTKNNANKALDLFIETYQDKYTKTDFSLRKDTQELLAFYDFPAKYWQSIRTSKPIESIFGTIRH
jgi:putative transposase